MQPQHRQSLARMAIVVRIFKPCSPMELLFYHWKPLEGSVKILRIKSTKTNDHSGWLSTGYAVTFHISMSAEVEILLLKLPQNPSFNLHWSLLSFMFLTFLFSQLIFWQKRCSLNYEKSKTKLHKLNVRF